MRMGGIKFSIHHHQSRHIHQMLNALILEHRQNVRDHILFANIATICINMMDMKSSKSTKNHNDGTLYLYRSFYWI